MKNKFKIITVLAFGIIALLISLLMNNIRLINNEENSTPRAEQSELTKNQGAEKEAGETSKKDLTIENYPNLIDTLPCKDKDIFYGNPTYWDEAIGINCYLNDRESILIRIFSQESTLKVISDWDEVITPGNQLVYSESWFATGPRDEIQKIFDGYSYIDVVHETPQTEEMSEYEFSTSMCSSIVYNIIQESIIEGYSAEKYSDYYKYYPREAVEETYQKISRDNFSVNLSGNYEYDILEKISHYDKQIKDSCKENPW